MKKIKSLQLITVMLIFSQNMFSQENIFMGKKIEHSIHQANLQGLYHVYNIFQIDSKSIKEHLRNQGSEKFLSLKLGKEYNWEIALEQEIITSPRSTITLATEKGEITTPFFFDQAYKGQVNNLQPATDVRLVVDTNFIYGYIKDEHSTYYIEPYFPSNDSKNQDWYLVYDKKDVIPVPNAGCGLKEFTSNSNKSPKQKDFNLNKSPVMDCRAVGLSIAADFSMFQKYGSSTANLLNYLIGVINNVNGDFDNGFNDEIRFYIGNLFFSTCNSCDPWTNDANAEVLLNDFIDWYNDSGFCNAVNDLHSLWTNRDIFGLDNGQPNNNVIGLAPSLGDVCENDAAHLIEDYTINANLIRSLVTHEIGHNFNCPHNYEINSSCDPPNRPPLIMDPLNIGASNWSNGNQVCDLNSVNTVNNYSNNLNCLSPCPQLLDEVWVDYNYTDCLEFGTFDNPFTLLSFGVYWVKEGGTIKIKSSSSNETLEIEKACRIESWGGSALIGQ